MKIILDALKSDFREPKDEYFIGIFEKYLKGEIYFKHKELNLKLVKPYSRTYRPKIKPDFIEFLKQKIEEKDSPKLVVYFKDGKYIMSDDYYTYYGYKKLGFSKVPCLILYGEI